MAIGLRHGLLNTRPWATPNNGARRWPGAGVRAILLNKSRSMVSKASGRLGEEVEGRDLVILRDVVVTELGTESG